MDTCTPQARGNARRPDGEAQAFKTGDGWFAYNLAVNLAQM